MELLIVSFLAGILTVLAPCVFTLLPITIGGSIDGTNKSRPYVIALSLGLSVFVFTLLLKASTLLIYVHPDFWKILSGGIIFGLGLVTIFPKFWDVIVAKLGLQKKSSAFLQNALTNKGHLGAILTGFALGPVFSSCSPTYSIILATVLPLNLSLGLVYLAFYCLGLILIILIIGLAGRSVTEKLRWAVNPNGVFKKILGIIFIVIGLSIAFGLDKKLETLILDSEIFNSTQIELQILEKISQ